MSTLTRPTRQIYSVNLKDIDGSSLPISADAFGRIRVSSPTLIGSVKQVDIVPYTILLSNALAGGATATYQNLDASTRLVTLGSTTSEIARISRRRYAYETAKSQLAIVTYRIEDPGANSPIFRAGLYDGFTGIYYEYSNGNSYVALKNNGSFALPSNFVEQSNWNYDSLDGTGPSGFTLNPFAVQIFAMAFEWLGVGNVVTGFFIDNRFIPVHVFEHANKRVVGNAYMRTPNLPLYWYCKGGNTFPAILNSICGAVISEGGTEFPGLNRADYNISNVSIASGAIQELLSLRLRGNGTTDGLNALSSATVFPKGASALATTNDPGILLVGYNPTFTGAGTWGDPIGLEGNLSPVQVCKSKRVVTSPGHVLAASAMSTATQQSESDFDVVLPLGMTPSLASAYGPSDIISLLLYNVSGSAMTVRGTLTWREVS